MGRSFGNLGLAYLFTDAPIRKRPWSVWFRERDFPALLPLLSSLLELQCVTW